MDFGFIRAPGVHGRFFSKWYAIMQKFDEAKCDITFLKGGADVSEDVLTSCIFLYYMALGPRTWAGPAETDNAGIILSQVYFGSDEAGHVKRTFFSLVTIFALLAGPS